MATHHLIIFVKNPIPGTVKTRIARTVGAEKATEVYRHLVQYTQQITRSGPWQKAVYYADFINPDDGWNGYSKFQQVGADLGERMVGAFREQFAAGAEKAVIIGSDCLTITEEHLFTAFAALDDVDAVVGPATDGGYYLLGMKQLLTPLFDNMPWSQPELRLLTEQAILQQGLTFERLQELTDIDEWSDYEQATGLEK
ncbi:TIGR04282 family arsenosugar biosynthesis glycosyltransferase [Fibrella forsythiae]|uniref:TIGR04282 family arsenosugar biosynthesis glycosyltransferase n=1 Tax=Fibrella forsythiae TaxID=2817061 RepID=A0ABS3JGV9_9BACT|nr:TIGR04282 family arsenosugar biosynthesis glycosyltransferase [Fibrella forsythiae]MBO0949241.1 TIGR04282 family arsenosugar biosynthesis glycosyltransferase [Fibrella forsythiae]